MQLKCWIYANEIEFRLFKHNFVQIECTVWVNVCMCVNWLRIICCESNRMTNAITGFKRLWNDSPRKEIKLNEKLCDFNCKCMHGIASQTHAVARWAGGWVSAASPVESFSFWFVILHMTFEIMIKNISTHTNTCTHSAFLSDTNFGCDHG